MSAEKRITELGLALPPAPAPVGSYLPATRSGKLIFTSGQLPFKGGALLATGKVGAEVSIEQAQAAAVQAVLNALAAAKGQAGTLESITAIVRLNVFVNSAPGFVEQAKVANGASDLLVQIFGDKGRHSRCAIGAAELPLNAAVELDLVLEVDG